MPADKEHRFGHGKAESLAALGQSVFVGGSAVFLIFEAGQRVLRPQDIENGIAAISVMVLSLVMTLALVQFQRYVIKETGSVAIAADSLHYSADLLVNAGIIIGLLAVTALGLDLGRPDRGDGRRALPNRHGLENFPAGAGHADGSRTGRRGSGRDSGDHFVALRSARDARSAHSVPPESIPSFNFTWNWMAT